MKLLQAAEVVDVKAFDHERSDVTKFPQAHSMKAVECNQTTVVQFADSADWAPVPIICSPPRSGAEMHRSSEARRCESIQRADNAQFSRDFPYASVLIADAAPHFAMSDSISKRKRHAIGGVVASPVPGSQCVDVDAEESGHRLTRSELVRSQRRISS